MAGIWLISCLAETNWTPFDVVEGERELLLGFNIEYGRLGFALIFMAEYASIISIGLIITLFFFNWGDKLCFDLYFHCYFSFHLSLSSNYVSPLSIW